MLHEKQQLLSLFDSEAKWCQGSEALDPQGNPVRYNDGAAVAWDLVGGMCHLFGWSRARELFGQLNRHIAGRQRPSPNRDDEIVAMAALFDFNDRGNTTFQRIVTVLEGMPVWHGRSNTRNAEAAPAT
jgi:hypothetical protein